MASTASTDSSVPPYVSYRTFTNFVNEFSQGVPSRIDRSVMKSVAGSVQAQLRTALRYLGMTDENGRTQDAFRKLATSEGAARQETLRNILEDRYPFLLSSPGFDLTATTPAEFTEQFRNQGAKGDTIRKCELFFLNAAKDAGITFSQHLEQRAPGDQKPTPRSRSGTSKSTSKSANTGSSGELMIPDPAQARVDNPVHARRHHDDLLSDYAELRGFIGKLPRSKQWTSTKRDRWIKAFTSILDWEIEVIGEEQEEENSSSLEN